jgi:predicted amidohydrolase YtcJ
LRKLEEEFADQTYYGGKVVTVDDKFSIFEAFAVRDGRFIAVGTDEEIQAFTGPKTFRYDLEGRTVIPGLIDSHNHLPHIAEKEMFVSLEGVESIADITKRIEDAVNNVQKGEWVRGAKVSSYIGLELKERRRPNRWDLDVVSPDNPVYIDGAHHAYVNSYALRLAGVTRDTPQPYGRGCIPGEEDPIEKDPESGEPTGVLREAGAKGLVSKLLPPVKHEARTGAFRSIMSQYNARGLTSILQPGASYEDLKALQELWSRKELTTRIYALFYIDYDGEVRPLDEDIQIIRNLAAFASARGFGDEMLKIGGIGELIFNGIMPREKLKNLSIEAAKNGLRVGVHAHTPLGGKALDELLDVWEEVNREYPISDKRFIILHATYPTRETFEKVKKLNLDASCQTAFVYVWPEIVKADKEGRPAYSPRAWLDNGIPVGLGSDACGTGGHPWDPFLNMWHAVTRISRTGFAVNDGQNITREEALRCYTINNARITFEEDLKGSIEPRKLADFVVLENDILTCPIDGLKKTEVLMTVVGGRVVYETEDKDRRIKASYS